MTKSAHELDSVSGKREPGGDSSNSLLREIQTLRRDSNGSDASNTANDLAAVNQHLHKMGLLPSLSIDEDHDHHGHDRKNHDGAKTHSKDSSDDKDRDGEHRDHGGHHHHGGHHNSSIDLLAQEIKQLDTDLTSHNQTQLTRDVHHFNKLMHSLGVPQNFDLEISDTKPAGGTTSDGGATGGGNSPVEVQPTNPVLDNPVPPITPVVPVQPVPPTVPSGGDISSTPISNLPSDGSLSAAAGNSRSVKLNSGIYSFNNFDQSSHAGETLPASVNFTGSGIDKTVIEMNKDTSTRAGEVPTIDGTTTNPLYLMRVSGGSPTLSNFTLAGTEQGHLYNGIRLDNTSNAVVKDVKITHIPGNSRVNPGETFAVNDYRGNNDYYSGLQIDGEGVGASGFASNGSKNVTVDGSILTNNKYSAGATFWETQNVTVENTSTSNNRTGLNFERVSGTVNIDNVSFSGNTSHDISVNNDQGSAKVIIENPHLDPGKKLTIYVGKNEQGNPNLQQRSDIEVIENGKDVTNQVVQWV